MTQPDRWDEIANQLAFDAVSYERGHYDDSPGSCVVDRAVIATALRQAYAEGEKAGMERAAVIAKEKAAFWRTDESTTLVGAVYGAMGADFVADAIRAAKETNTPPSPS